MQSSVVGNALAEPLAAESPELAAPSSANTVASPPDDSNAFHDSAAPARREATATAPPEVTSAASRSETTPLVAAARHSPADRGRAQHGHIEWYGWQTLVSDAASLALVVTQPQASAYRTIGLTGFVAVPPVIHFAHRNPIRGLASLGLRVAAPAAGLALGALGGLLVCGRGNTDCISVPATAGLGIGAIGAVVLDAAVLGRKDRAPRRELAVRWRPLVMVGKTDARIGVAGTF